MVIAAAGTLPWRTDRGRLEVALVHRPKYDDWSWPKGKIDTGELSPVAAARETLEETGRSVVLGRPLPSSSYTVLDRGGHRDRKHVDYWASRVVGGSGALVNEIDEVRWLPVTEAHAMLDYARDREQLAALLRMHQAGRLATWPLLVVRHAHAVSRSDFSGPDPSRPLDRRGESQAQQLATLLAAYGPQRVVSSPSERCLATVEPYARAAGLSVETKTGLSEEGHAAHPDKATHQVGRLLARAEPVVVCSHGPVLPPMLARLAQAVPEELWHGDELLRGALSEQLGKGEALVAHVIGVGGQARIVAAERRLPGPR